MVVFVVDREIDLADASFGAVGVNLAQDAQFQAAVARHRAGAGQRGGNGVFAGQGVAEGVQVVEEVEPAADLAQRLEQGRDEEARDPAVQAVADPGVVALGEFVFHVGVEQGVDQARQQGAFVGQDVGVVHRDHGAVAAGQQVAQADPEVVGLAVALAQESGLLEAAEDGRQARAVVPDDGRGLGQHREEVAGLLVLGRRRAAQGYDHPVEVADAHELVHDMRQGVFGCRRGGAGQHQRNRALDRVAAQAVLQSVEVDFAQLMKSCQRAALVEVSHV
ncbi:MAG: hypothetical protein BWY87_00655 [Deltaproteobacteria bacterium ADurb.Bin510]|nr:MAG: hypothetical protein BWY87_00655 [Deltaproteobacteria bacterium ADurb.Bin510]